MQTVKGWVIQPSKMQKLFMEEKTMKKIVALVLCLALALALCTVAFADTTSTTIKAKVLDKDNKEVVALGDVTKVVTSKVTTTDGSKSTTTYTADKYVVGDTTYAAVSADAAWTHKIIDKDGKLLATVIATDSDLKTSAVITKSGVGTGKTGDYEKDAKYVIVGDKAYTAEGNEWAVNSKGEFVQFGGEPLDKIQPNFNDAKALKTGFVTYDANGKIVSAKDSDGKTYTVVAKGSVPASYTGEVLELNGEYVILLGAAAAETPATGVTSAKTFDAGVAMYAGLALMSVAGSAVVIGKKKEF